MSSREHRKLMAEFVQCLEESRYYDAHESLEEIWFPRRFEKAGEMKLLKDFINAAVSFELIKRGRLEASERAWQTYLKYRPLLENLRSPYLPAYKHIAVKIEARKRRYT